MTNEAIQSQTAMFLFPRDPELTGMLSWMGDHEYPTALTAMLARGFHRQQPGTRLAAVKCLKRPELVTSFFTGTLNKRIRAIFLVETLLVDPQGNVWMLEVKATCTGRMLSRPEDGILASDVKVQKVEQLVPTGQALLEDFSVGVECEKSGQRMAWDAPLEEVLACLDPHVETEEDSHYLSWENEAILGGLEGHLFTSFSAEQPGLRYISISPVSAAFSGSPDDGLLPEWEYLTRLFGPPDELRPGCGFRWALGSLEILLLYQECNNLHPGDEFQKWITIRWLGLN